MNMKRITFLFVAYVMLHTFSNAASFNVNFTSSEGYVNGLLGDHEKWSVTVAWPGAWVVDADNGWVSADKTFQVAKWGQQFLLSKSGDKITFRVEFDTEIQNLQLNGAPLVFGFTSNPNIGSGVFNLVYIRKTADSYVLRNNDNSAPLSPLASLPLNEIQATPSTRTKLLAVEVTLTLGDNAANTTISGKIFNVTDNTSSEIGLYTGVNASLFSAATTTGIYGTFQSGIHNAQPKVYKVSMTDTLTKTSKLIDSQLSLNLNGKILSVNGLDVYNLISIYSLTGKLVLSQVFIGQTFNLNDFPKGVYVIKTSNYIEKFIL